MKIIVTGGSSPLALNLVRRLCSANIRVELLTRTVSPEMIAEVGDSDSCVVTQCDLISEDDLKALCNRIETEGDVTGLVFGHRYRGADDQAQQYQLEVLSPWRIIKSLALVKTDLPRSVVFLTSPAAKVVVGDAPFQYHASKAAINALVRYGAVAYAKANIRVNAVSPGAYVQKERSREFFLQNPDLVEWAKKVTPMGRFASAEEISSVVSFFLGPDSSFVTGQVLEVDGGTSVLDPPGVR